MPAKSAEPALVALDTSCLIALVSGWHEHHDVTLESLERRLRAGATMVVPAHALAEAYAVLTRLPAPNRLSPVDAIEVLGENFESHARTVWLDADEYWSLLRGAPTAGVYGGRIYDAVIAACARKAKARELLTWNLKHFEPFADGSLVVASPA
ncbi:MAG: type II toxin-antitoxin system VapC family toxin [Deltaproteobacteria bacterium]|nr:MAG: type II toxin-antitoxin system VapC family toxin [Deltaproteobacteria bacterium]